MVEHSWSASWINENGERQFWRCTIRFAADDPKEPITAWVGDELLPVLVPALQNAPVSVSLSFARHEGS